MRLLVIGAAVGGLASAEAGIITVTNTADSGTGSFRQAIEDAQEDDAINFAPNVRGTIALLNGELFIWKGLTIRGPGANQLALDARAASRVLRINARGKAVSIVGLTLTRGHLAGAANGGGIWNNSNLTLTACTVSGCSINTDDSSFGGAGIYNEEESSIQIIRCTLNDNLVLGMAALNPFTDPRGKTARGGALYNHLGGTASLQNCTITGNVALGGAGSFLPAGPDGDGLGAGIYNDGDLVITSCTIGSNAARRGGSRGVGAGGGVWNTESRNARIGNTIVAGNIAEGSDFADAQGSFQSDGFNLIGSSEGTTGFTADSDQTGTRENPLDPRLGLLQDNGGPTFTRALQPGSPAIDAGTSAGLVTDQRGVARTHDYPEIPNASGSNGSDIGSFEAGSLVFRLANISTRVRVQTGGNALFGGFIITGTEPKTVIVRGIGPSLALPGALADPIIEVYSSSGALLAANDNWRDGEFHQQVANTLPPASDLESALWGIINPGAYTVQVRGKDNTTGIGLFEVYDLDETADSMLANISTRGFVESTDVMIGGTIITGHDQARVLVRAIGPSLTTFGIPNALSDPTLELHDGNGAIIASNDNWRSDQEAEIIATGIPPTDDRESAIVASLVPGNYTAIVRGESNATGVAVVEAYALN